MNHLIASGAAIALLAAFAMPADAGQRSAADLELYRLARQECQSWKHMPDGASIHINYAEGWFRCEYRGDRRRDKHRRSGGGGGSTG